MLRCNHSNKTSLAELPHSALYFLDFTKWNSNFFVHSSACWTLLGGWELKSRLIQSLNQWTQVLCLPQCLYTVEYIFPWRCVYDSYRWLSSAEMTFVKNSSPTNYYCNFRFVLPCICFEFLSMVLFWIFHLVSLVCRNGNVLVIDFIFIFLFIFLENKKNQIKFKNALSNISTNTPTMTILCFFSVTKCLPCLSWYFRPSGTKSGYHCGLGRK